MASSYAMLNSYAEIGSAAEGARITAYCEYRNSVICKGDLAPVVRIAPDGVAEIINMRWDTLHKATKPSAHELNITVGDILPCLIPVTVNRLDSLPRGTGGVIYSTSILPSTCLWKVN